MEIPATQERDQEGGASSESANSTPSPHKAVRTLATPSWMRMFQVDQPLPPKVPREAMHGIVSLHMHFLMLVALALLTLFLLGWCTWKGWYVRMHTSRADLLTTWWGVFCAGTMTLPCTAITAAPWMTVWALLGLAIESRLFAGGDATSASGPDLHSVLFVSSIATVCQLLIWLGTSILRRRVAAFAERWSTKRDLIHSILMDPNSKIASPSSECIICFDSEGSSAWRRLKCGHAFHEACLTKWLERPAGSCPCCRQDLQAAYLEPACGSDALLIV